MTKIIFKNKEDLKKAERETRSTISYRKMKDGHVVAAKSKWPKKKKSKRI